MNPTLGYSTGMSRGGWLVKWDDGIAMYDWKKRREFKGVMNEPCLIFAR